MINRMLNSTNPAYYEFSEQQLAQIDPTHYPDLFDKTIYESDEFRMYGFKIKRCPRMRSHDWTQCPFAHRGEKARRRDPRRYNYAAFACPDFRDNECLRGDACHFAHGIFEYWLHPAKYRTRACNAGGLCQRKVCFFAHSPIELRDEEKYHFFCPVGPDAGDSTGTVSGAMSVAAKPFVPAVRAVRAPVGGGGGSSGSGGSSGGSSSGSGSGDSSDFLASLSGLTVREGDGNGNGFGSGMFRWCVEERSAAAVAPGEGPDVDWITEMVE